VHSCSSPVLGNGGGDECDVSRGRWWRRWRRQRREPKPVDRLERACLLPSDRPAGGRRRQDRRRSQSRRRKGLDRLRGQSRVVVPGTPAVDAAEGIWWPGPKLHRCYRSSRSRWRSRGGRSRSPRSRNDEGTTPQDGGVVRKLLKVSPAGGGCLTSTGDGAASREAVVAVQCTDTAEPARRESKSPVDDLGEYKLNGKHVSSKTTCLEMIMRRVERSRQR